MKQLIENSTVHDYGVRWYMDSQWYEEHWWIPLALSSSALALSILALVTKMLQMP